MLTQDIRDIVNGRIIMKEGRRNVMYNEKISRSVVIGWIDEVIRFYD